MNEFHMDAHMHFDLYDNRDDVLDYIVAHKSYTIVMTNLPQLFEKYNKLYGDNKYVRFALGFHPELVNDYKSQLSHFFKLIDKTKFVGEIGLDFSNNNELHIKYQIEVFEKILCCCTGKNKILSIHSRLSSKKVLQMLTDFNGKVIMHWYSGRINDLNIAISRGYYFSINHQMLQSLNGRKIIKSIPINRILLESDAPFTKGLEKNYSLSYEEKIYKYLADIYFQNVLQVKNRIKKNFYILLTG